LSHFNRAPALSSPFSRGPKRQGPGSLSHGGVPSSGTDTTTPKIRHEESPSGRRFGELLLEERIITTAQLETAVRLQAASQIYVPLGQVLLSNKVITRKQLNALLHRHKRRSWLGEILLKADRITAVQLHDALAHQRRTPMPIGQALIRLGYLSEATIRDALCTQLHVNFFDLDPIWIDQGLSRLISTHFATRHLVVPLLQVNNIIIVAVDDPSRAEFIDRLQADLGLQIEIVTTTTDKLKAAIARLYGPPLPPNVNVFSRRNILIGPIRDPFVADLAAKGLRGVTVVPPGWQ
jgi:hypothetical protein